MVKEVDRQTAERYLGKAEEFYETALNAIENKKYDAAMFNATQAIFLANDAFCIHFLGRRASKDHRESVNLHLQAARVVSDTSKKDVIAGIFDERSESGYTEKFTKQEEARKTIIQTRRFIDWVGRKIAKR